MHFLLEWCVLQIKKLRALHDDVSVLLAALQRQINAFVALSSIVTVENRDELKGLDSSNSHTLVFVRQPESGVARAYTFVMGDATVANDFSIIAPTDNGGRYFEWFV